MVPEVVGSIPIIRPIRKRQSQGLSFSYADRAMHTDYAVVLVAHESCLASETQALFHSAEAQELSPHGARHGHRHDTSKELPFLLPTPYSFARIDGFFQDEGAHETNQRS